jgi:hypothetical protein
MVIYQYNKLVGTHFVIGDFGPYGIILLRSATMKTDFHSNSCTTGATVGTWFFRSYAWLLAVLHNNGNRLLMISGMRRR